MAGKVNTKFVVLLSVGLVAVFGLLAWAFVALAFKSGSDHERMGDQAMRDGDFFRAQQSYGRAVNKDTTNRVWLDKWVQSMESWIPDTETAYRDAYMKNYRGAINQIAAAQRTDIDAHERLINLFFVPLSRQYSRPAADGVAELSKAAAAYFDRLPDADPRWKRLLRYRGLAMEMVQSQNGVLEEGQIALIAEDLRAALEADPSDGTSFAALMRWTVATAMRSARVDDDRAAIEARIKAMEMGREFLQRNPNEPSVELAVVAFQVDQARDLAVRGQAENRRMAAVMEAFGALRPELDRLEAVLRSQGARVNLIHLSIFQRLETALDGGARLSRTRSLIDDALRLDPDDAEMLSFAAAMAKLAGDLGKAEEILIRIGELPTLPIGLKGIQRFELKRVALLTRAEVKLDMIDALRADEGDRRRALMDETRQLRQQFAGQVSEDNLALTMLDGRIAEAEGRLAEAQRLFRRYNEQTQNASADGLWAEARTAYRMGQLGTARTALERTLAQDSNNFRAVLVLADVESQLQNNRRASELYRRVLSLDPTNQLALAGMQRIEAIENPASNEDPVLALLFQVQRTRFGGENVPPDPASASRLLEQNIERLGYDPRVASELASMRVDMGDMAGARAVIAESARRYPDEVRLARTLEALQASDSSQAVLRLIELSDRTETEKQLAIASIAVARGVQDRADAALAELARLAPDDPQYIELAFVRALQRGDLDRARVLAEQAERADLDRVRGLSFRARIAGARGNHADAVTALRQATALGTADAGIFRLLAMELRAMGRIDESVQAFERSLQIRPDDIQSIFEYVLTLAQANRLTQALDTARRYQRFGMANPSFVEVWLNLEAVAGGDEGLARAVAQREQFLQINPADVQNRIALARLYVEQRRWADAKVMIDRLRAEDDSLQLVELAARWSADQGRVGTADGMALAQQEFQGFIDAISDESVKSRAFLTMARFFVGRGRADLALRAAEEAVAREDRATMEGSKLKGNLLMQIGQYGPAAQAFQAVVDAGADDEAGGSRVMLVECLIQLGRWAQAAEEFAKLPAPARGTLTNLFQQSAIAIGRGDQAAARRTLDEAVAKFPQEPLVFIRRAQSMLNNKALRQDFMADLDAALRLSPNDWRALRLRSVAHFQDDRRTEALRDLREAVRQNPGLDDAVFGLLNEYLNDGRASEAATVAREVADRRAQDAPLMAELGRLFESREQWDRASEFYGRAWNTRRNPNDGANYIDMLLRRSPPDANTANTVITDLAALMGGNIDTSPGLLAAQALVLRARGREDFALQQMTKAFEVSLEEDARMFGWGSNVARFYLGMAPESELNYYRSLRTRYTDPRARAWLDLILAQRSIAHKVNEQQAMRDLLALGRNQQAPEMLRRFALRQHGNMLFGQDRFQDSVESWRVALEFAPDDWELNNNIAYVVAAKLNRPEEGLPLAEKALKADPNRSEAYDTLAGIYIQLGKLSEAAQMLDQGDQRSRSYGSRVALTLTRARLELAKGNRGEAERLVESARAVLRGIPGRDPTLEAEIQAVESQIGSGG